MKKAKRFRYLFIIHNSCTAFTVVFMTAVAVMLLSCNRQTISVWAENNTKKFSIMHLDIILNDKLYKLDVPQRKASGFTSIDLAINSEQKKQKLLIRNTTLHRDSTILINTDSFERKAIVMINSYMVRDDNLQKSVDTDTLLDYYIQVFYN
jgi:hypothetical protein